MKQRTIHQNLLLLTATICLSSPLVATEIYECKDENGIPYFTETPCGPDGIVHKINSTYKSPPASSGAASHQSSVAEQYAQSKRRSKLRSLDLKMKRIQSEIDSLTKKRDAEIEVYHKKILRNEEKAGKNKKKAELRNKGNKEKIAAINDQYNRKIAKKQDRLSELREEADSL